MFEPFTPHFRLLWEGHTGDTWHETPRVIFDTELIYTSEGRHRLSIAGDVHEMSAGGACLIPPGVPHETWVEGGDKTVRHCVHFGWQPYTQPDELPIMSLEGEPFDETLLQPVPPDVAPLLPLVVHCPPGEPLRRLAAALLQALRRQREEGPLLLWPVLQRLLALGARSGRPRAQGKNKVAMYALKHLLDTRYADSLSYQDFRRVTGLSDGHLCTSFRRLFGLPPTAYLIRVRLDHARRLLRKASLNVSQVARRVGIRDPSYFARLFRKHVGRPPSEFA